MGVQQAMPLVYSLSAKVDLSLCGGDRSTDIVQDNLLLAMDPDAAARHDRNAAEQVAVDQDPDQSLQWPVPPNLTLRSSAPPDELRIPDQSVFDENEPISLEDHSRMNGTSSPGSTFLPPLRT